MQPSSDSLHNHTQNIKWRLSFGVEGGCDVWTFVYFVKRGKKCVCVCVCVCVFAWCAHFEQTYWNQGFSDVDIHLFGPDHR